jgi:hypothetical protein
MSKQIVEELDHYVAVFRGIFLNRMTVIERIIEMVIANHFCHKEKQVEFTDFLLGEKYISFDAKKSAFYQILAKHHKDYYKSKKAIFDMIDYVQPERNKIAHYMVCVTDEALERFKKDKTFGLLQYYEKKEPIWFDVAKQTKIAESMDILSDWFEGIRREE